MAELLVRLQQDLNAARKSQDRSRTVLLGTVISELKNRKIELRRELEEQEIQEVLSKGIKRRRESIEMFEKGAREDLVAKERSEIGVIEAYLPEQATDDEIRAAVRGVISTGSGNLGAVMGAVRPRFAGRADGSRINAIAREELAGRG
ncbi:MAG: GatB/YqeY domain-containing protein [Gemmatimonadaceae bacterium]